MISTGSVSYTHLCGNNCQLTVNIFPGGKKYISGNRCDRPVTHRGAENPLNLYEYKLRLLESYKPEPGPRGTIGLPLALNMYELLPFWHTFFTKLGFSVVNSGVASRKMYLEGQSTIPSDTVCYPAKLVHGHIHRLSKMAVNAIFYPCMTYNVDEGLGDNCYNCPVAVSYTHLGTGYRSRRTPGAGRHLRPGAGLQCNGHQQHGRGHGARRLRNHPQLSGGHGRIPGRV